MKYLLPLFFVSISISSIAQITLSRTDYDLQPDDTIFTRILAPFAIGVPEEGADVQWDYTNTVFEQQVGNIENAGTHPDFPNANIVEMVNINFVASVGQETHFIEELDEEGHKVVGREVFPAQSDLVFLTSSFSDSLNFLGGIDIYENPLYIVRFPLNYQDTFSSSFSIVTPFELTLPIIGFNQAYSEQIAYLDYQYEVSSWGTLTLPNPLLGGGEKSFEALLLKRTSTRTDSFFIDSLPADPNLLGVLGLGQGQITSRTNYTFWVKDLNRSALSITVSDDTGEVISASMSRDVNNFITTSTKELHQRIPLTISPNPANQFIQYSFDKKDHFNWKVQLINNMGQLVLEKNLATNKGLQIITQPLPNSLKTGTYFFLLRDGDAEIRAKKTILIVRDQ